MSTQRIVTNLWFDTQAEEAIAYYCSIFEDARVLGVVPYPEGTGNAGAAMVVEFELLGQRFVAINGGPQFTFSEAISLQVECEDQAEIDYYWEKLTDGGSKARAGGARTATGSRGRSRRGAWTTSTRATRRAPRGRCRRCSR